MAGTKRKDYDGYEMVGHSLDRRSAQKKSKSEAKSKKSSKDRHVPKATKASRVTANIDAVRQQSDLTNPSKEESSARKPKKEAQILETATDSDPIAESDTTTQSGEDDGVSWPSDDDGGAEEGGGVEEDNDAGGVEVAAEAANAASIPAVANGGSTGASSKEAHAKQKVEKQERKAAKPNADSIARAKKLWERLRRKSHVPREERQELVAELFDIITGRVKEFVFKHDSVRVVQTALKYANLDQRKMITKELKGEYKTLAESKYAKFLIGKMLVHGDGDTRDLVVPEFYGHVKRLIKHSEASWILDDIYRGIATPSQKATMLREWYGAEYALFKPSGKGSVSADLKALLADHPEKRTPIMRSLYDLINSMVQKKTTGFTMLHDAMLQYFLNIKGGSEESTEFLELLKGDEEGDLLKNLAFTKSGARLVCLALACGNAKDRKQILKTYKDTIQTLAYDTYGHQVLLAMYDVIDDTVLVSKSIFPELIGKNPDSVEQQETILTAITHLNARIPLIYPFCPGLNAAILPAEDTTLINEIHRIRTTTSKKDPEVRRKELINSLSAPLLYLITANTATLMSASFGCQLIGEVLPEASGDRGPAMAAIAKMASGSDADQALLNSPHAGRLLKSLVLGGRYNKKLQMVVPVDPPLGFHDIFYEAIKADLVDWAIGNNSFVIVGLLEAPGFSGTEDLRDNLRKSESRRRLQLAASDKGPSTNGANKKSKKADTNDLHSRNEVNKGSKLLLRKLDK